MSKSSVLGEGHKLLILVPWQPKQEYLARLAETYPSLDVICHKGSIHGSEEMPTDLTPGFWKDVTILLTWRIFPSLKEAPSLRYVQLLSAGCNHIMDKPIYTETDIAFCTANGVHP